MKKNKETSESKIIIFKVMIPSWIAWPPGKVIMKVCYSRESAESYISTYPNPLLSALMTIEDEYVYVTESD